MTGTDTISLSLRNLSQSKLRTLLTTLGVSIGIASLAGMLSLGIGLQEQVVGRFLQAGVFDTITVTSPSILGVAGAILNGRGGGRGGGRGRGGFGGFPGIGQASIQKLDDDSLKQISALENVREAYPNFRIPLELTLGEFSRVVTVTGVPSSAKSEGAFQTLSYGTFFNSETETACMVTLDLAKQLSEQEPGNLIGKSPRLSYAAFNESEPDSGPQTGFQVRRVDLPCQIVGIVERDPAGSLPIAGPPSGIMMPIGVAKRIDGEIVANPQSLLRDPSRSRSYGSITVKVKQARFTQDVEDRLRRLGYAALSVNDALRGAKTAFIILDVFLSVIGSIALAVSSLGIVNTMVMSILERTREIGIMKAIGASDNDIRRIFLIEASVIGLFGGLVGVLIGWFVGQAVQFATNVYIRSQGGTPGTLFSLPLWVIASVIAFSIVVSLIAGSYPASRAARLDPIQALRHD